MFKKFIAVFIAAAIFIACGEQGDHTSHVATTATSNEAVVIARTKAGETDTVKKSIPAIARGNINGRKLVIHYHSPAVKNRIIMGGLVPYQQVWVTGAHAATRFECPVDFIVAGKKIPAGTYALFTIPGTDEWTFIINKNWEQHLADEYNEADDVVRTSVKPQQAGHQERLRYEIHQTGEYKASIEMHWEKLRISVPVELVH
jgi:hypothetical protein